MGSLNIFKLYSQEIGQCPPPVMNFVKALASAMCITSLYRPSDSLDAATTELLETGMSKTSQKEKYKLKSAMFLHIKLVLQFW